MQLPLAAEVLDVYHGLQHIVALGRSLFSQPSQVQEWTELAWQTLLSDGWNGIESLTQTRSADQTAQCVADMLALLNYLNPH